VICTHIVEDDTFRLDSDLLFGSIGHEISCCFWGIKDDPNFPGTKIGIPRDSPFSLRNFHCPFHSGFNWTLRDRQRQPFRLYLRPSTDIVLTKYFFFLGNRFQSKVGCCGDEYHPKLRPDAETKRVSRLIVYYSTVLQN
jgi:hypothetical protein